MVIVACAWCGGEKDIPAAWWRRNKNKRFFCGNDHRGLWQQENWVGKGHPRYNRIEKRCEQCRGTFSVNQAIVDQCFCSPRCSGLAKSGAKHPAFNPEVLHRLYVRERKSLRECGAILGVDSKTVRRWVQVHLGATTRSQSAALKGKQKSAEHKRNLSKARRGKPMPALRGRKLSPESRAKIREARRRFYRENGNPRAIRLERAVLEDLYCRQGLSLGLVGVRFGCSAPVVAREMKRHGIPIRPSSRVLKRSDGQRRLRGAMKAGIQRSLKGRKAGRSWEALVGYTVDDLAKHLQRKFQPGMTWDNYGSWQVDHVFPQALFTYESHDDPDFQRCWALDNLQPLWAEDNNRKKCRLDRPFQPAFPFASALAGDHERSETAWPKA